MTSQQSDSEKSGEDHRVQDRGSTPHRVADVADLVGENRPSELVIVTMRVGV